MRQIWNVVSIFMTPLQNSTIAGDPDATWTRATREGLMTGLTPRSYEDSPQL
jgi:hypothetical protein